MNRIAKCAALPHLPLIGATGVRASDAHGIYTVQGSGDDSCGTYFSGGIIGSSARAVYAAWLAGFLTAINASTPGLKSILSTTDIGSALGWIDNYCQQHPTENLASAAESLVMFMQGK
jgi:hypothetical protein